MNLQEIRQLDKDSYFILKHFIKRNFKVENNEFDEIKVIKDLFFKLRKYKTRSKMYIAFSNFLIFLKENKQFKNKEINYMLNNIPKPKYERKSWRTWKKVSERLKFLKKLKRKVEKDIKAGEIHKLNKLNNIKEEIKHLSKRKKELGSLLK